MANTVGGVFGVEVVDAVWFFGIDPGGRRFWLCFHAADAWGNEYIPPCNPPEIRLDSVAFGD